MARSKAAVVVLVLAACLGALPWSQGVIMRCFTCRSRGERGSCKDPFRFNLTTAEMEQGLEAVPCSSGWCAKIMEGGTSFKDDDYDMATERMCLPRGPSDSEERCSYTVRGHKKVYMCFCAGDLCNQAPPAGLVSTTLILLSAATLLSSMMM